MDYFDDERKKDFSLIIRKDKERTTDKIELLSKEIETLKMRLNLNYYISISNIE